MFNFSLKKDALEIHQKAVDRYNDSYDQMCSACDMLYTSRECALGQITYIEILVSSIAHRPKEFDKQLGQIKQHILLFHQTQEYADEAYKEAVKSGVGIFAGVATGGAIATATPHVAMSIATTFGRATTGRAISTLSGNAAKRAALGWIGRKTGGIATKGVVAGSGLASGKAFLALLGNIGWGVSAVTTTYSLISMTSKNKKISENAINEAKEIMFAREILCESTEKINQLQAMTQKLTSELKAQAENLSHCRDMDYLSLCEEIQLLLGALVNNTLSLAALLNQVIE